MKAFVIMSVFVLIGTAIAAEPEPSEKLKKRISDSNYFITIKDGSGNSYEYVTSFPKTRNLSTPY